MQITDKTGALTTTRHTVITGRLASRKQDEGCSQIMKRALYSRAFGPGRTVLVEQAEICPFLPKLLVYYAIVMAQRCVCP